MADATRRPDSPGPTREEVGSEYWDPPCRVCKVVDDEANVLCELCNDAYHLACIDKINKPTLPRSPEDDEWFCRACVKRGVPEVILDRVGRDSSAHYLVQWLGKPKWDVSWEHAKILDTAWSRKLISKYVAETEPARKGISPILPPCHRLVDLRRSHAAAAASAAAACPTSPYVSEPAPAALAAGVALLQALRAVCLRVPESHPLGALAAAAARLARLHRHPRCASLAQWSTAAGESRAAADTAIERAVDALKPLSTLANTLGKRGTAKRLAALQSAAAEAAHAPATEEATILGKPTEELAQASSGKAARQGRGKAAAGGTATSGGKAVGKAAGKKRAGSPESLMEEGSAPAAVRLRLVGEAPLTLASASAAANRAAALPCVASLANSSAAAAAAAAAAHASGTGASHANGPTDEQLAELRELCARRPEPAHMLARVALVLGRALSVAEHAEWSVTTAPAHRAAEALRTLLTELMCLLGPLPTAAASEDSLAAAKAACTPNTYRSFLMHLKEQRAGGGGNGDMGDAATLVGPREAAAAADALAPSALRTLFVVPREAAAAADAFAALSPSALRTLGDRANAEYRSRLGSLPNDLLGLERRGGGAGGRGGGRGGGPCRVCGESDRRDCLTCHRCDQLTHLMCFFPPKVSADEADGAHWTCDECAASLPPPLAMPKQGDELEAEVAEPEGGAPVWKRAIVLKVLPRATFRIMINPDEEDDFIEEYGMHELNKEWRWPQAAIAAKAAARAAAEQCAAAVAEKRAAEKAALAADVMSAPSDLSELVEEFYKDGICVLKDGLSADQVEACDMVVDRGYKQYMHCVKTLELQERLSEVGFMEIKMRSAGRYDLQLPELSTPAFSFVTHDAPWMALVHALLGKDAVSAHEDAMSAHEDATSAHEDAMSVHEDAMSAHEDAVSAHEDAVRAHEDAMPTRTR